MPSLDHIRNLLGTPEPTGRSYHCKCYVCGRMFVGFKREVTCDDHKDPVVIVQPHGSTITHEEDDSFTYSPSQSVLTVCGLQVPYSQRRSGWRSEIGCWRCKRIRGK